MLIPSHHRHLPVGISRLPIVKAAQAADRGSSPGRPDAVTLNPIGAPIAHIGLHIAAVTHSSNTGLFPSVAVTSHKTLTMATVRRRTDLRYEVPAVRLPLVGDTRAVRHRRGGGRSPLSAGRADLLNALVEYSPAALVLMREDRALGRKVRGVIKHLRS
jgi:hypothetical protein